MKDQKEVKELQIADKRPKFEVEKVPQADTPTETIILTAMQKGYDPDFIEKLLDIKIKAEANEARKAYHDAMSRFKKDPPKIIRDKNVEYEHGTKKTSWSHSDLGVASEQIGQKLGENDLNHTWRTEQLENGNIKVTCTITHKLGHSESTFLVAAPDTSGSKNFIQAIGSTVFYLERYTLFAATGIAPIGMDDDGNTAGKPVEYITLDMQTEINDLLKSTKANKEKFLKHFKSESVETIPITTYGKAISLLKAKQNIAAKKPMREPGEEG